MSNDEIIYKEFGERLKLLRKERSLTQTDLANVIGLTQSAIYNYEKGNRKIPMSVLKKFANYFEMSITELIGLNIETPNDDWYIDEIKSYELSKNEIEELMNYVRFIVSKRN